MDTSKEAEEGGGDSTTTTTTTAVNSNNKHEMEEAVKGSGPVRKGKSCKGYLYYSSTLKSNNRNPRCIGLPRTLPQVPNYVIGQSEVEASKEGRTLLDFYYACAGYSMYETVQGVSGDTQPREGTKLPVCVGVELLVDKKVSSDDTALVSAPAHTHAHGKKEVREFPPPQPHNKPAHSSSVDDFLNRFTRNASVVASGVARNMLRVGNYMKESIDDFLFPYRKRPK